MGRRGYLLVIALLAASCGVVARADPAAGGHHPDNPRQCFWVHGRLFAANGAPTLRIWLTGTKRILGVKLDAATDAAIGDLPASIRPLLGADAFQVDVDGDFQVCPLSADRPGRMRLVRMIAARRLITRPVVAGDQSD